MYGSFPTTGKLFVTTLTGFKRMQVHFSDPDLTSFFMPSVVSLKCTRCGHCVELTKHFKTRLKTWLCAVQSQLCFKMFSVLSHPVTLKLCANQIACAVFYGFIASVMTLTISHSAALCSAVYLKVADFALFSLHQRAILFLPCLCLYYEFTFFCHYLFVPFEKYLNK